MRAAATGGKDLIQAELIAAKLGGADAGKALDGLQNALVKGETIRLPGFGQFEVAERGKCIGRDPQTGAEITVAASKAPKVSVGKALKDAITGNAA